MAKHPTTKYAEDEKLCCRCKEIKPFSMFHKCSREKDGLQDKCKDCKREMAKQRYKLNKEKILAVNKAYREADPERTRRIRRNYKENNRDKIKAYEKANPDKVRAWKMKYIDANRDKHMLAVEKYQKENREKVRDVCKRRRKYIAGATKGKFSSFEIYERDKWICQICQQPVDKNLIFPHPMSKSIDHIIPISRGGSHEESNVQLAHLVCNKKAGAKKQEHYEQAA